MHFISLRFCLNLPWLIVICLYIPVGIVLLLWKVIVSFPSHVESPMVIATHLLYFSNEMVEIGEAWQLVV